MDRSRCSFDFCTVVVGLRHQAQRASLKLFGEGIYFVFSDSRTRPADRRLQLDQGVPWYERAACSFHIVNMPGAGTITHQCQITAKERGFSFSYTITYNLNDERLFQCFSSLNLVFRSSGLSSIRSTPRFLAQHPAPSAQRAASRSTDIK